MSKQEIKIYSSNVIKKAGKKLIENNQDEESLEILSSWRSEHAYPLEKAVELVRSIANEIDRNSIIAKRLKRTASIIRKLERYKDTMKLSTMNDIGGCRIVLSNQKKVNKFIKFLTSSSIFKLRKDYIKEPKKDGYKSVHLIGEFANSEGQIRKIELQVRTKIQHSWATALEIVDLFTQQSIKTNMGDAKWSSFFKHTSHQFGLLENNDFINSNNIKLSYQKFIKDFREVESKELNYSMYKVYTLCNELDILNKFTLFKDSLNFTSNHLNGTKDNGYILIKIDKIDNSDHSYNVNTSFYNIDELAIASKDYLETEKATLLGKSYVTALVSIDTIGDIETAYPNYFADSTKFIEYINILNSAYSLMNPSFFKVSNKIKYMYKDIEEKIQNYKKVK